MIFIVMIVRQFRASQAGQAELSQLNLRLGESQGRGGEGEPRQIRTSSPI